MMINVLIFTFGNAVNSSHFLFVDRQFVMALYLKMVLQLVDDWTSWAVVTVVLFGFRCLFKCTFWSKMILRWSNNMCSGGRLGLVVGFGFGFGCNWGCGKTKGRWSSKVGARFTSVAKEFHLGGTVVGFSG